LDGSNAGVWYTSPLNNATEVAVNTQYVYVIFSNGERMDATTVGTPTITLSSNSGTVGGDVNYYDYGTDYVGTPTAVFTPSSNFNYSTVYTITVGNEIKDMAGNNIGTSTYTFTTISAPASPDPGPVYVEKLWVTRCYPENDIADTETKVYARLCMFINSDDINLVDGIDVGSSGGRDDEKFFKLTDSFGNRIAGRTKGHSRDVIFTPDSSLTVGEKYTATVKTTVRAANAAGTQMESPYSWSFTVD